MCGRQRRAWELLNGALVFLAFEDQNLLVRGDGKKCTCHDQRRQDFSLLHYRNTVVLWKRALDIVTGTYKVLQFVLENASSL
jgi:hypothetical protein